MVPSRLCSAGSITSTRLVPSASGLPGQSAAPAADAAALSSSRPNRALACIPDNLPKDGSKPETNAPFSNSSAVTYKIVLTARITRGSAYGPACRRAGPVWGRAARHDMHHAVAARFKRTQKRRHHGGGLLFGIVKQHDAATGRVEPGEHQPQFLVRRHRVPVARPSVRAEY